MAFVATAALTGALALVSVVATPSSVYATPPLTTVSLGTASTFAVLSGASVANTASVGTILRGDLGAPLGTITGFPPGVVNGTKYDGGSPVTQALAALGTAYTDAASRTPAAPFGGDLIGLTFAPGVYSSGAAVTNSGIVTLDAGGVADAVFIFQITGALTMAASTEVKLIGGAQASRVFWQAAGAATVGATAKFAGTILARDAISVGAGTEVNGRALAKTGAIGLDTNSFYSTPPALTITGGATATTNDSTPTIAGTTNAAVGATVTVTIAGQTLTTTVLSGGTWSVTAAIVANNTYSVVASVADAVGNLGSSTQALTVDTVLPVVTITGGATAITNDPTPTIAGTTDVAVGQTVSVTIAGQSLTALVQTGGTWNVTAATVAEGAHSVVASVTDPAGNPGSATQSLTIDTVAPTVTITGGATALTNDPTPTIAGTTAGVAVGATVTVTIAGQTLTPTVLGGGTWSTTAAFVADGAQAVVASAADLAGNPGSATQTLTIDTVAPTVTITGGATAVTNDPTPTITGTTNVAVGATVTVTIAGQTLTTLVQAGGMWNVTPTTVANGAQSVVASVTDPAGNPGSATQTLTIDTVAPTLTITGGPTALTNDPTPTISGTTDVGVGATVTVTIAGQTLSTTVLSGGTWTVTAATVADGAQSVAVSVTDTAGNPGSATQALTTDTVAPAVTITGGATALTNDPTPTITGTTNVASGATVTVTIAGQTLTTLVQPGGTWNVTPTTLVDGAHPVVASVTDPAGNPGNATQTLTIDSAAPTVTITGGATALTTDPTPTIAGTTTAPVGATVTVTVAGQTLTTTVLSGGAWTVTATTIADGAHDVVVSTTDLAGNPGAASQSLTVYTTPPIVTITGGATALTNDATPTIAGTTNVAVGRTVTVTIAGQTLTTTVLSGGTWTVTAATVADGAQSVAVSVTDGAGNPGNATQTLTIDTLAPTVTITGGATAVTNDPTPTITGTTNVSVGATVTVTIAGQTLTTLVQAGGTWNVTPATIADGTRDLIASVIDPAGNPGSATQSFTVDTLAPTVTITGGATALTNDATPTISGTTSAAVGATVTVTVAGQTLTAPVQAGGTWTVTAATLTNTAHPVVVSAFDTAGNPGSATQSLTIDTVVPVVTITGGATALINDATPTIMGTTDVAAGVTVTVTVAGQTLTTLVQGGGTWNATPAVLANGTHAVVVSVADPAGNPGSATQSLTIDTLAPTVTITGGATASTNDSTPTITGTTDIAVGSTVTVTIGGQTHATTALSGGTWTATASALADGNRDVVATVVDPAGNSTSATQSLTVDTAVPVVPVPVLDFTPVGPKRIFDTRPDQSANALRSVTKQRLGGVIELQVKVTDLPGLVPATGVVAVSLNVTATAPDGDGFLTVYACGTRESVSSVNYRAGQTVANAIITPVSATGTICIFSSAPADVIADINGWFAAGKAFSSVGPKRVFDTRPGQSPQALRAVNKAMLEGGNSIEVQLTDLVGYVPASGVGAVSLNVTATNPSAAGFLTVYSCGTRELVSSVNYGAGQTVANAVIAPVSATGTVCFYTTTTVDVVVDINGWLKAGSGFTGFNPQRVLDTRPGESPGALRDVLKQKIGETYVLQVKVTDLPGVVPATGVGAVSLNVTATNPDGTGFVTIYACGTREDVSSLNYTAANTVANAVLTPVSTLGTICVYSLVPTDVIIDINGWFANT